MDVKRVARGAAWTLAACVMLVVALYLVLLAINWRDEAPSAQAVQLQRIIDDRPAVADARNAYVLMLGIGVPPDQDPFAWGVRRKAFIESFSPADAASTSTELPGQTHDFRQSRTASTKTLMEACRKGSRDCGQQLRDHPEWIDAWLTSEGWLLDRYLNLVALTQWRESISKDPRAPFPPYVHGLDGQWLLLMKAWQSGSRGDADAARELLQKDQAFWRTVLGSSDMLITRMIATAAIERNFLFGNLMLRELRMHGAAASPPAGWNVPIHREDWSMKRALAGEWRFMQSALDMPPQTGGAHKVGVASGLADVLFLPMFKKQATTNLHAANLVHLSEGLDVEVSELPAAIERLSVRAGSGVPALYNPIGDMLVPGQEAFVPYAGRVSDLEGVRRAVLLALELRPERSETAMAQRVGDSALDNPYSNAPFMWEAQTRSIVFQGLTPEPRGRYVIPL